MTIIHKADKRKGAAPAKAAAPEMDRTVANCLCCGKVYDCRESSSNDMKLFVGEQSATVSTSQAIHALTTMSSPPDTYLAGLVKDHI